MENPKYFLGPNVAWISSGKGYRHACHLSIPDQRSHAVPRDFEPQTPWVRAFAECLGAGCLETLGVRTG
jgi:hypothetical protein